VRFFKKDGTFPVDVVKKKYEWLNPGETRFFKLRTPRMYSTDFRVTVDWVAWPAGKKPNTTFYGTDNNPIKPHILELKDVRFNRCSDEMPASPQKRVCYFRVVVGSIVPTGGDASSDVDIGLFDSSGKLIDVILTEGGMAGTSRLSHVQRYGYIDTDTSIWSGLGCHSDITAACGMGNRTPGLWELRLYTNQPVDSMVTWKGGPW
jgi:hypothetical protein